MKSLPYIKPYSDIFIHYLLAQEENKDLLLDFINAVLIDSDFPKIKEFLILMQLMKMTIFTTLRFKPMKTGVL